MSFELVGFIVIDGDDFKKATKKLKKKYIHIGEEINFFEKHKNHGRPCVGA